MADNVSITAGSGTTVAADEVTDGTLGTVKVQYVKVMDGTIDGTTKLTIGANGAKVDIGTAVGSLIANQSVNTAQINGVAPTMGNGISGTGVQRVTLASDSTGQVALATGSNTIGALTANQSVNTAQINGVAPTMGNGISGTGVQRVTIASDSTGIIAVTESGTWTVQPGNTANTTPWLTTNTPSTSGGYTIYRNLDTGSTGANIKASAGQVFGYYIYNNATSVRFVKFYNKATAPTVGTDTPVITLGIPASSAANVDFANGIAFATGIGIGATTGVADNNTTAPSSNDVVVNIYYK